MTPPVEILMIIIKERNNFQCGSFSFQVFQQSNVVCLHKIVFHLRQFSYACDLILFKFLRTIYSCQVLGVEKNAGQREIQKAFHKYILSSHSVLVSKSLALMSFELLI